MPVQPLGSTARLLVLTYVEATSNSLGDGIYQEFRLKKLAQFLVLSLQPVTAYSLLAIFFCLCQEFLDNLGFPAASDMMDEETSLIMHGSWFYLACSFYQMSLPDGPRIAGNSILSDI